MKKTQMAMGTLTRKKRGHGNVVVKKVPMWPVYKGRTGKLYSLGILMEVGNPDSTGKKKPMERHNPPLVTNNGTPIKCDIDIPAVSNAPPFIMTGEGVAKFTGWAIRPQIDTTQATA